MFSARLNEALAGAIEEKGVSLTAAARQCGRAHPWLLRKLLPEQADPRPLYATDVDVVLETLGIDEAAFLARLVEGIRLPKRRKAKQ